MELVGHWIAACTSTGVRVALPPFFCLLCPIILPSFLPLNLSPFIPPFIYMCIVPPFAHLFSLLPSLPPSLPPSLSPSSLPPSLPPSLHLYMQQKFSDEENEPERPSRSMNYVVSSEHVTCRDTHNKRHNIYSFSIIGRLCEAA